MYVTAGTWKFERAWSAVFASAPSTTPAGGFADPASGAFVNAINMLIEATKKAHPDADAIIHLQWQVDSQAKMIFVSGEPIKRAS